MIMIDKEVIQRRKVNGDCNRQANYKNPKKYPIYYITPTNQFHLELPIIE